MAAAGASAAPAAAAPVDVVLTDTVGLNGPMTLATFATSAAAGDLKFNVKNTGTVDHELIVLKSDTAFDKLPIVDGGDPPAAVATGADKVDEGTKAGETGDPNLKPGGSRTFTIKAMAAGNYVLVCNLAKHYGLGMRAPFTVAAAPGGTAAAPPPGPVSVALSDTAGLNAPMTVVAASTSAAAGDVVFNVKNTGTVDHELIVLKTDTAFDKLPIVDGGDPPAAVATGADKVDEGTKAGETGDPNLKPGGSRTFTIKAMAAGNYVLVCNLAKHYGLGMRAPFTVAAAAGGTAAAPPPGPVSVVLSDTAGLNGPMTVVAGSASAAAGDVIFTTKNTGTVDHELIVLKTDTAFDKLPIVDGGDPPAAVKTGADKVDEGTKAGETGDPNLKPGGSRTFTIKAMAAGSYVLVCNLAKHYGLGMRAPFTVVAAAGGVAAPPGPTIVTLSDTAGLNGPMTVVVSSTSTAAGDVIFTVTNTGTVDHELIVLKTGTAFDQLPVVDGGDPPAAVATGATKVDEGTKAGETGDPNLKPGQSRTFTIKAMAAGSYVLVCNLAKHYGLGMRAPFTVS